MFTGNYVRVMKNLPLTKFSYIYKERKVQEINMLLIHTARDFLRKWLRISPSIKPEIHSQKPPNYKIMR
jgi:hypothetical protein